MKRWLGFLLLLSCLLISCTKSSHINESHEHLSTVELIEIPSSTMDLALLAYDNKTSLWTLDSLLFSGYALSYYEDGTLKEKLGIYQGRKQNEVISWYPDGHYHNLSHYHMGKLHGQRKIWSPDTSHTLLSQLNYHMGKLHGIQKKWYDTGEVFKVLNMDMGQEQGMQHAYRKNGDLFANYEAREGRIFGLKKAALCYGLENEEIQ